MSFINDLENIWELVKEDLSKEITPSIMSLWFGPLKIYDYEDNTVIFETESEFNSKFLTKNYIPMLEAAFTERLGFEHKVSVVFTGIPASTERIKKQLGLIKDTDEDKKEAISEEISGNNDENAPISGVLPIDYSFQYTFDNFIVGSSNKFAHAACTAVAAHPAKNYNPLYIYGPSGLGKTHLMSAIVNEITRKNPRAHVLYIKGEDFTNEMIECMTKKDMSKFHDKYRKCDILLIDDIQFISGKPSTQEEFFHTFNVLYENRKQIVLSSDCPPKDIPTLEDRLKTRFEWGLIADIQPPDLELRIAIIKKKAEQVSITIPDDVLIFLAENLRSNIRQIEGTIKKLSAIVFLEGKQITMEIAAACLQEITGGVVPVQVIADKIFSAVYNKYGFTKTELLGEKRTKNLALARHITIYLIRQITELSYPSIGDIFKRDHTTILASCNQISKKINTDPLFNVEINELIKEVSSNV